MAFRLLLTGDVHLGRTSSRVPDALRSAARAATAWGRLVALAIREQVALVLLSGDIVDECNRFWEAIGPLEAGVNRLAAAAIPVLAVAGNHDYAVLSRLADQLPGDRFVLLGRDGQWERWTLMRDGRAGLHIDGWSFPRQRVTTSPLIDYDLPPDPRVPVLGCVHGDLGVGNSSYAPLDLQRLQLLGPHAWLLGHLHTPRLEAADGRPWVLMPGSPQALDPGETGPHGPWLATVDGLRIDRPQQYPLSTLWYETTAIDVSAATDASTLDTLLLDALRARVAGISRQAGDALRHISLRLTLTGATPLAAGVREVAQRLRTELDIAVETARLSIDRVAVAVTPPVNLAELAASKSALGAVARLLLDLDQADGSAEAASLLRAAHRAIDQAAKTNVFSALGNRTMTDERVRDLLRAQARALLTRMMVQTP